MLCYVCRMDSPIMLFCTLLPLNSTTFQRILRSKLPLQASYESSIGGASNEYPLDGMDIMSLVHQPSKDWMPTAHHLLLLPLLLLPSIQLVTLGEVLVFKFSSSQRKPFRLCCSKSWRKPINSLRLIHCQQAKQIQIIQSLLWSQISSQISSQICSISIVASSPSYQVSSPWRITHCAWIILMQITIFSCFNSRNIQTQQWFCSTQF